MNFNCWQSDIPSKIMKEAQKNISKGLCIHRGVCVLLVCLDFFKSSISYTVSSKKNLQDNLFNDTIYNKLFRPENTVTVEAKYKLQYVISVNKAIEDGRPTEDIDSVEKSTPLKPYSNQELAEFFDNFVFVVFTVLYILILASAPVVAIIWRNNSIAN
ncbi:unnamed protein product [Mytilus coruscus]|uniref:Uncharacterized protein n=1 Tax=Mytilus coruscus TaxID=42192 RepID=A0A6J8B9U9_MYTCO|nr:unnamed protein product [Mytilus coruscus]